MRYFYERPYEYSCTKGVTYSCDHTVYSRCTLYLDADGRGLAVIQQRYNRRDKSTCWTEIDEWLVDDIYNSPGFKEYFNRYAAIKSVDIYPTVTVRQIMWALKMKPLQRQLWETNFDKMVPMM